ncbi:MAG: hypothetical protein PHV36_14585 [Elusimicrobiales bacterium]|nr:hypothetical protein [Elusimicrobiales bacterium]
MKMKIAVIALVTGTVGAFAFTCTRNPIPSDLRDALNSDEALNVLKAASREAADEVPLPAAAQRDSEDGLLNPTRIQEDNGCGPDYTIPLGNIIHDITDTYNSWPIDLQKEKCASMDVDWDLSALGGWDIMDLRADLYEISGGLRRWGKCKMTVEVDGKCYRHEEVNYVMWGLMTQLCGKSLVWSEFKTRAYLRYYYLKYRSDSPFPGEADNKIAWTEAGYYGWPKRSGAPPPTRPDCSLSPGAKTDFPPFRAVWYGDIIPPTADDAVR